MSILAFTWNADGLRICETQRQSAADETREGMFSFLGKHEPCVAPTFFQTVRDRIILNNPEIVAFTTQDEAGDQTYFHAEFLPKELNLLGYRRYMYRKLEDVGRFNLDTRYESIETGMPDDSALRFSVYIRSRIFTQYIRNREDLSRLYPLTVLKNAEDKAGAIACYLRSNNDIVICLTAVNLPLSYDQVTAERLPSYRRNSQVRIMDRNNKIMKIVSRFRDINYLEDRDPPDLFIMLGDFGLNRVAERPLNARPSVSERDEFDPREFRLTEDPGILPTWPRVKKSAMCSDTLNDAPNCFRGSILGVRDRIVWDSSRRLDLRHQIERIDDSTSISYSSHRALMGYFVFTRDRNAYR